MEKETLEEAAVINYKKLYEGEPLTQDAPIDAFKDGAKWKAERMYSEEEVKEFMRIYARSEGWTVNEIFEQFKKK